MLNPLERQGIKSICLDKGTEPSGVGSSGEEGHSGDTRPDDTPGPPAPYSQKALLFTKPFQSM